MKNKNTLLSILFSSFAVLIITGGVSFVLATHTNTDDCTDPATPCNPEAVFNNINISSSTHTIISADHDNETNEYSCPDGFSHIDNNDNGVIALGNTCVRHALTTTEGNVGIGTNNPTRQLTIDSQTPSSAGIAIKSSHNSTSDTSAGNTTGYIIPLNNGLSIDAKNNNGDASQPIYIHYDSAGDTYINHNGGNVGIGTDTPTKQLTIDSDTPSTAGLAIKSSHSNLQNFNNGNTTGYIIPLNNGLSIDAKNNNGDASQPIYIHYDSAGDTYINHNGGNVGIGTTSPSEKLHVAGNINANGTTYTSDERYKKNINTLPSTLQNLQQLRGVSYDWRQDEFPDKNFSDDKQIGVIAQELESVYPELVQTNADGYKSVSYSKLTPILLEAIKEQQQTIQSLEAQMVEVKQQIVALQNQ